MTASPVIAIPDLRRQVLRHTLATVAYRAGKALRGSPDHFSSFHIGDKTRTPAQILAHMGDRFDWALSIAQGNQTWHNSTPLPWDAEIARFFAALKKFDDYLASSEPLHASAGRRRIDARRPNRYAAPPGLFPRPGRKLLPRRHLPRPRGTRAIRPAPRIRVTLQSRS